MMTRYEKHRSRGGSPHDDWDMRKGNCRIGYSKNGTPPSTGWTESYSPLLPRCERARMTTAGYSRFSLSGGILYSCQNAHIFAH